MSRTIVAPTPIADMIAEMHENGIQLDMIIVAVRSMERALSSRHEVESRVDVAAEKRRAWDREYRRDKRNRPPDPPDIHLNPPDVGNCALSSLSENKKDIEVSKKKERGQKLPPDWTPNENHYAEGQRHGMTRPQVDACADRMRNWCDANANRAITTKANWDAAFMGAWLKEQKNGHNTGSKIIQAADDLRRKVASFDGPPSGGFELRGGSSSAPARLLPDWRRE
jgi:hypothetical protein